MILAFALIRCDHPGCQAIVTLPAPLRFGQLNPIQVGELRDLANRAGWVGRWLDDGVEHFCPEHVPPTNAIPMPAEMAATLAQRLRSDGK